MKPDNDDNTVSACRAKSELRADTLLSSQLAVTGADEERRIAMRCEKRLNSNGLVKWKRGILQLVLLLVWVRVVYLLISQYRCGNWNGNANYNETGFQEQLMRVSLQLETLRREHSKLISRIRKSPEFNNLKDILDESFFLDSGHGPMEEYENLRRRIYSNTKEFWYYVNHNLHMVTSGDLELDDIQTILDRAAEIKRSILSDQEKFSDIDGYQDWRHIEAADIGDLVQRRLHYLQNPLDCRNARKLVCNVGKSCGFGCELNHLVFCLIFAYATERTLVLNSIDWWYQTDGWNNVFNPISETCNTYFNENMYMWPVSFEAKVIMLPNFVDFILMKPKFVPRAIPEDIGHRIIRFNGDSVSWWIGQMIKYMFKPCDSMQKAMNETIAKMDFQSPIVGIHIRRTDKIPGEAQLHHIYEYMNHVKDYYYQLELTKTVDVKRVYIATDDASILEKARQIYPEFKFVGDPSIAEAAARHRYSMQSLIGALVDIQMLSHCDYIVCTLSSTFGRVAYGLMQTKQVDASKNIVSLDDIYYFHGQSSHVRVTVIPNAGTERDLAINVGDVIDLDGKRKYGWNGFSITGINIRTNTSGVFPWYKTEKHLVLYPFPKYEQVSLHSNNTLHNRRGK